MKNFKNVSIGVAIGFAITGAIIATSAPAKAQFSWADTGGVGNSAGTFAGAPDNGYKFREPVAPAAVGGAPVEGGKVSWLVEYYADQAKCLAEGRCVARKVVYSANQKAWMTCKEVYKFQDAHRICGGFPIH